MNKTVYIVTNGSYSDYCVVAVFSSEKKASDFSEHYPEPGIVEMQVDAPDEYPPGLAAFRVMMDFCGNTDRDSVYPAMPQKTLSAPYVDEWSNRVCFFVWAKDEQHAVKIANEKRAQMIAIGELTLTQTRKVSLFLSPDK